MDKEIMIKKLTSRKFWLALAAFVTELIVVFRGDAELAESVSAIIMAGATVIAYIVGEGLIDASSSAAARNTSSVSPLARDASSQQSFDRRTLPARRNLPREGKA